MILTVHEDHLWFLEEEKEVKLIDIWKNVDAIIRVNKLDVPTLEKYNKKVFSIPNGFDHDKFKPMDKESCRKQIQLVNDKYIILSLGHLNERKGFHNLIEAAKLVAKERTDFKIIIGGSGPMKNKLQEQIHYHKLVLTNFHPKL